MMPPDASLPGCLSHLCEVVGVRQLPAHLEANDDGPGCSSFEANDASTRSRWKRPCPRQRGSLGGSFILGSFHCPVHYPRWCSSYNHVNPMTIQWGPFKLNLKQCHNILKSTGFSNSCIILGKKDPKTGIILHHVASCSSPLNIQFSGMVSAAAMRWGLTKR